MFISQDNCENSDPEIRLYILHQGNLHCTHTANQYFHLMLSIIFVMTLPASVIASQRCTLEEFNLSVKAIVYTPVQGFYHLYIEGEMLGQSI